MRAKWLLVLLALVTPTLLASPVGPPVFSLAVVPGLPGVEPTVALAEDGAVLYATNSYFRPASLSPLHSTAYVMRTEDDGATWTDITPPSPIRAYNVEYQGDPLLHRDPRTGAIYSLHIELPCESISVTHDGGATWSDRPLFCDITGTGQVVDHAQLFTGPAPAGSLLPLDGASVLYMCYVATYGRCAHSVDDGFSWLIGEPPFPTSFCAAGPGQVTDWMMHSGIVLRDGTVLVPRRSCGHILVARSDDLGMTWSMSDIADDAAPVTALGEPVAIAADAHDRIFVAYTTGSGRPTIMVSSDAGISWDALGLVGPPEITFSRLPSLLAIGDGAVALAFWGTDVPGGIGAEQSVRDTALWNAYVLTSRAAHTTGAQFETTLVNPPGDPVARGYSNARGGVFDYHGLVASPTGALYYSYGDVCHVDWCEASGIASEQEFDLHSAATLAVQVGGAPFAP